MPKSFIIAIDRSTHNGVEVFSVVATHINSQNILIRYSDFFKHMRKLGSQKRTYVPKMLRIIKQLIDEKVILGLKVFTRLGNVLELVESRKTLILACVVDNNTYNYYTTEGIKSSDRLRDIPLILLEDELKKPSKELIKKVRRLGLTMVYLRIVMNISDNIANYARSILEGNLENIPTVWRL